MLNDIDIDHLLGEEKYSVYNARWIMLFYMSMLNLLSDWTCYSVAPIAIWSCSGACITFTISTKGIELQWPNDSSR